MKQRLLLSCLLAAGFGLLRGSSLPAAAAVPAVHRQVVVRPGSEERTLVIYPTSGTGLVHLVINGLEGRRAEISVLNVIGTVMYRETLTELNERATKTIDLRNFANGLYYVKLEADNSSQLCKLIIAK